MVGWVYGLEHVDVIFALYGDGDLFLSLDNTLTYRQQSKPNIIINILIIFQLRENKIQNT